MKRKTKKSSIYQYLDSIKILESGTDDDISQARKKYWREYKAGWRRQKRKEEKELTTSWTVDELKELIKEANRHKVSKTKFIKTATIAYIDKRYIVPDQLEVRKIIQSLAMTHNIIGEMIDENVLNLQTGKMILEKIFELEREIRISLYSPKTIDKLITEAVINSPQIKQRLYHLLKHIP